MKDKITLYLFVGLMFGSIHANDFLVPDSLKRKVVFIIVDGISADQLKEAHTPNLDAISKVGSYTEAFVGGSKGTYTETPTISAVGYNSLLTGTWAYKHNVWGNGIKAPNYSYPTIFRLFKDNRPNGTIAVFSSWLDNRTKLVGEGLEQTGHIKVDYFFDGLEHDTINYPHDRERNFMKLIDFTVADKAAEAIENYAPDLSWVYLEFTDDMGHRFGDSERFNAAVHFEDDLVGRIYKAIESREENFDEEWLLVVTTDHGRSPEDGRHHGGQSLRERSTWIITNLKETNAYFKEETPAIVDILPTMTDFMGLQIPVEIQREWDGVSLIKHVDAFDMTAQIEGENLRVSWKAKTEGKANLLISKTNEFPTGGTDRYEHLESVKIENGGVVIPVRKLPKGFFKLLLKTPNTTLNTWVVENK
ncbi:MAG: nucleotide pyrophosphatase [Muricauda sp.]|nr:MULTISPECIES: alkaline phosphatase family protein [unclassified Allomuricauda]MAU15178.1 nucleotide pyrophosphatase [Allomuricauda sp.]|tara:strand:- start:2053 stop:3306 length:1254 start_codon:yes stop_codon:yes gene_type:complete